MPVARWIRNLFLNYEWNLSSALYFHFEALLFNDLLLDFYRHLYFDQDIDSDRHFYLLIEFDLGRYFLYNHFYHFCGYLDFSVDLYDHRHFYLGFVSNDNWDPLSELFAVLDRFLDLRRDLHHLRYLLNSDNFIFFRYLYLLKYLHVPVADLRRA